jgi:peptidoglycan/LPS O-acetylase OafA/YrhL
MNLFVIAAAMMAVVHLVAAAQRPRLAVLVSAILWLLYAYYERQIATGVLCEKDCNIRVDLVFFFPILGLATYCAYQAYNGRPGQMKIIGSVLGVIGLFALGLVAENHGYGNLAFAAVVLGVLAIAVYAFRSKSRPNRT